MKHILIFSFVFFGLAGCEKLNLPFFQPKAKQPVETTNQVEPVASSETDTEVPPPDARTVEDFDITSKAERAEAAAQPASSGAADLGITVASLGAVGEPGFWLKTPLVDQPAKGRVEYYATGKTVNVDLIPRDVQAGGGSQISLSAMRLLGAPLTGLPELRVFKTRQ